jgi:uncharacterized protein (TIGR03437 family)
LEDFTGMHSRIALPLLAAAIASGQTITTFAGNGTAGFSGDGGQAGQAAINNVVGLAADSSGNIYLADQNNNRVRKVSTTGVITTIAGTATGGFSGDGGLATQAALNTPTGVCVAPSGDVYVNDEGNHRVRKIAAATGIITTVAGSGSAVPSGDGGQAISAGMQIAIRCAVDSSGNLYIVDQGASANVIRKVDANGIITLYAGAYGGTSFSGDGGLATKATMFNLTADAFDASGNLFLTDQGDQRIRRVDTTGIITTVAGSGTAGYSGDGGVATAAQLNFPGETAIDSAGNLFILDTVNQRVRKVSGGMISTVAGTGTQGFAGDGGPPLQAQFNNPFPMTIDPAGNLYIGDNGNNRIRKITGVAVAKGPSISVTSAGVGVTNAASFQTGIAPGGIITIFGTNLGATAGQTLIASGSPWPAQLGSTSVTMNGITAPVYYVLNQNGSEQLSVQAPWSLSGANSASVVVTTSVGASSPQTVSVLGAQPGIFLLDSALSGATHVSGAIVSASSPAARGEVVVLYLTGGGPVMNQPATGAAASSTALSPTLVAPQVTIGGFAATPAFSGLAPGFIGTYQINVAVPQAVASGLLDLTVQANGVTSNTAKLAVQ